MEQYTEHKAALEAERAALTEELNQIASYNEQTGDWVAIPDQTELGDADENVEADATEEWNERRALMTQLETRYRNLERALEKFAAGTYGTCEISGEPIEAERLAANPAARTCLAHKEEEAQLPL